MEQPTYDGNCIESLMWITESRVPMHKKLDEAVQVMEFSPVDVLAMDCEPDSIFGLMRDLGRLVNEVKR